MTVMGERARAVVTSSKKRRGNVFINNILISLSIRITKVNLNCQSNGLLHDEEEEDGQRKVEQEKTQQTTPGHLTASPQSVSVGQV